MKRLLSLTVALVAVAGLAPLVHSQEGQEPPNPPKNQSPGRPGRFGPSLTDEERARFDAARTKAEADPAVVAAAQDRDDLRNRQQDLLKKALGSDPAALEALEKMGRGGRGGRGGKGGEGRGGEQVDPAVRAKVQAARKAARQNPEMQELQKKSMEANKKYQEAFRAAMIAADPGVGSLLDKMEAGRGEFGKRRGGRGGRGDDHKGGGERPEQGGNTFAPSKDAPMED